MKTRDELNTIRDETLRNIFIEEGSNKTRVVVGMGTCGIASGANEVYEMFMKLKNEHNIDNLDVVETGCIGVCMYEPMAEVYQEGKEKVTYIKLNNDSVCEIVDKHILNKKEVLKYTIKLTNDLDVN